MGWKPSGECSAHQAGGLYPVMGQSFESFKQGSDLTNCLVFEKDNTELIGL